MSEDFLSRWSRRKREVARAEREVRQPAPEAEAPEQAEEPRAASNEPRKADEVDLSTLPPLEEITGTTDISGFLRRGVPEELARSALRKVWSSDPAIRDFVGLSENAWDFNDPNAIPGFGPIDFSPDQVRQMAAKLVGDLREVGEQIARVADTASQQETETSEVRRLETPNAVEGNTASERAADEPQDAAAQNKMSDNTPTSPPGRHGGALPR